MGNPVYHSLLWLYSTNLKHVENEAQKPRPGTAVSTVTITHTEVHVKQLKNTGIWISIPSHHQCHIQDVGTSILKSVKYLKQRNIILLRQLRIIKKSPRPIWTLLPISEHKQCIWPPHFHTEAICRWHDQFDKVKSIAVSLVAMQALEGIAPTHSWPQH
jgi:hypothetical protein